MLSTACPSYPVAISIAGPILTVLSLTGGLFANVGELPSFISWVSLWHNFVGCLGILGTSKLDVLRDGHFGMWVFHAFVLNIESWNFVRIF